MEAGDHGLRSRLWPPARRRVVALLRLRRDRRRVKALRTPTRLDPAPIPAKDEQLRDDALAHPALKGGCRLARHVGLVATVDITGPSHGRMTRDAIVTAPPQRPGPSTRENVRLGVDSGLDKPFEGEYFA